MSDKLIIYLLYQLCNIETIATPPAEPEGIGKEPRRRRKARRKTAGALGLYYFA
jgi:hypothetical protein